jgi:hypothetical protein
MFFRIFLCVIFALFLFGCDSKSAKNKVQLKKEPPSGDLLSDVAKEPTYGHQAIRTLKGAREIQRNIKNQQKERQQIKEEAD